MQYILIALRNLSRQRRRTLMLGGAIAFGIFIVTLINGFAGSFVQNVGENFSQLFAGHIFVEGVEKQGTRQIRVIRDDQVITDTLLELGIPTRFISRRSEFEGEIVFQGNTIRQGIIGADWTREDLLKERLIILEGSFDDLEIPNDQGFRNGIILTDGVARRLRAQVGDVLTLRMRTVTGQQNLGDFRLSAISYDPGLFGSLSAYADLEYVNSLIGLAPGEYQTMGIFVGSISEIDRGFEPFFERMSEQVQVFPRDGAGENQNQVEALFRAAREDDWEGVRYRLYTLNDVLQQVQQIVDLLNNASLVILLVLFFIIMVGITNTFRMIMIERVKEIGTIRALGMQRPDVMVLFLLEAFFLALFGALMGLGLAGITMAILSQINLGLDSPIYILLKNGYLTFVLSFWQVILNFSVVIGLTIVAAFIPSRKAALMPPVDALRA
jgi:putative ABC transport system permease protein